IYFDRQFGLDETLLGIERVTAADVQRVAADLFRDGSLAATVLGNVNGLQIPKERLELEGSRVTPTPRWAASGATSAGTRPGCSWRSRPPTPWPPPASCRKAPRATSASAGRSTPRASKRSN